jgi:DNA-binding response OmpR family regulator
MEQRGDERSVLLVEDEVLVRLSIADELRQAGLTVLEAANADEASTVLESHSQRVGLVLTDIQMPGRIDGRGLVRLVRERYADVRVIVLTGSPPDGLKDIGADTVLAKPHSTTELIAHIKRLLGGSATNGSRNTNARHN